MSGGRRARLGKYSARPTTLDGYRFDSQAEARRWAELKLLEQGGAIRSLVVHPVYELVPSFKHQGHTVRAIKYEGDFEYCEGGRIICEDVKGFQTAVFKLKAKLMAREYPDVELRIVQA